MSQNKICIARTKTERSVTLTRPHRRGVRVSVVSLNIVLKLGGSESKKKKDMNNSNNWHDL